MKSRAWDTFLPIPDSSGSATSDDLSTLDAEWLAARGVCKSAPIVLKILCDLVAPLVKRLGRRLDWYSFLVHDRSSGVPAAEGDLRTFVHLRLVFKKPVGQPYLPLWEMTRAMSEAPDVVGDACRLISYQSECLLRVVEGCRVEDEARWVKLVKSHLHFFANMAQMRVE